VSLGRGRVAVQLASRSFSELGLDVRRQRSHVQQDVEHGGGHRKHEASDQIDLRVGHRGRISLVDVRGPVRVPARERLGRWYGTVLRRALRQSGILLAAVESLGRQIGTDVPGLRGVSHPRQPFRHAAVRSIYGNKDDQTMT